MDQTVKSILEAWSQVLPEAVLVGVACVQFLLAPFLGATRRRPAASPPYCFGVLSLIALGTAFWLWSFQPVAAESSMLSGPFRPDGLSWYLRGLTLATGVVLVLSGWQGSDVQNSKLAGRSRADGQTTSPANFEFCTSEPHGECQACLLLILAGVNLVALGNDLVGLFLALELVSIPTYVLLYLLRPSAIGQEAVLKYFLLSVFSSALLLYGFSLLYGVAGTTNLQAMRAGLSQSAESALPVMVAVALVAVIAGIGFRVTAVPFHFYAPDVFQGTHTVGAALLSIVPKLAGFAVLLRLVAVLPLTAAFTPQGTNLPDLIAPLIWWLAVLTMCVGNVLGLLQKNLRRILAYSSIAHGGYMLVGLAVTSSAGALASGIPALLFYLAVYAFMTVGAFAVLIHLSAAGRSVETLDDLAGAGRTRPGAALLMAVFLFSLTGLPPTAGFFGKLNLLLAAWSGGTLAARSLAVLMAVNAAIGAVYYLRIIGAMYLRPAPAETAASSEPRPVAAPALLAALVCAAVTLALFLAPQWLFDLVTRSAG